MDAPLGVLFACESEVRVLWFWTFVCYLDSCRCLINNIVIGFLTLNSNTCRALKHATWSVCWNGKSRFTWWKDVVFFTEVKVASHECGEKGDICVLGCLGGAIATWEREVVCYLSCLGDKEGAGGVPIKTNKQVSNCGGHCDTFDGLLFMSFCRLSGFKIRGKQARREVDGHSPHLNVHAPIAFKWGCCQNKIQWCILYCGMPLLLVDGQLLKELRTGSVLFFFNASNMNRSQGNHYYLLKTFYYEGKCMF